MIEEQKDDKHSVPANSAKLHVGGSLPFPEDGMKRVQAPLDELSQLLNDCNQLISGFAMDEVWSEWDESVRQRLVQMQIKVNDARGQ